MSTLKRLSRIAIVVIGVFASGLFLSGVLVWRLSATSEQDTTSAPTGFDVDRIEAFLAEQMLGTPRNEEAFEALDDLQLLLLGYEVEEFRYGAVMASETKAMAELPQVAPGALRDLLEGELSARFPYIWSYVMAGSFFVTGNSLGDDPIVAFYNPYFDVALLTTWSFTGHAETETEAGFKLIQAVPVTGRAFLEDRPSLSTDEPIWTDSKALFEVRIVNAAQGFVAAFEARYPPFGRDSVLPSADADARRGAVSVAESRVFSLLRWVIDGQNPSAPVNYAPAIKRLRGALSAASSDELEALLPKDNPQTAGSFFRLGPDIREGMKPYLVVDRNVILIDPVNLPTAFISVHFKPADGGHVPGLVSLFDLEASLPST